MKKKEIKAQLKSVLEAIYAKGGAVKEINMFAFKPCIRVRLF
jgi:hypothetical protein